MVCMYGMHCVGCSASKRDGEEGQSGTADEDCEAYGRPGHTLSQTTVGRSVDALHSPAHSLILLPSLCAVPFGCVSTYSPQGRVKETVCESERE